MAEWEDALKFQTVDLSGGERPITEHLFWDRRRCEGLYPHEVDCAVMGLTVVDRALSPAEVFAAYETELSLRRADC